MVLTEFLTETRRRWLKAFKMFKRHHRRSRVSPDPAKQGCGGTVNAASEIDLRRFTASTTICHNSLPPMREGACMDESDSHYSYNSYEHSRQSTRDSDGCSSAAASDSAYNSARSSPSHVPTSPKLPKLPVCYAAVSYFHAHESDDSCSIGTEYTLLDYELDAEFHEEDEKAQNILNESIELVSTL